MGETIFMIHGMWGGSWNWDKYRSVLEARGYGCVATTLPYHGTDPREAPDPRLGTTSLLEYAEAVEHELMALRARPVVIGHSMGGLLAQILGARGLAKALVLLAPAAPAGIFAVDPSVIQSFWSIQTTWGFWRLPVRPTFREASYSMLHLLDEKERREAYDRFVHESGRAVFEIGYWPFDLHRASRVDESRVTCPMLVIAGAQDRITPAWVTRHVARKYASVSTFREFQGHAHWLIGEPGWGDVVEYLCNWLRSLPARSREDDRRSGKR